MQKISKEIFMEAIWLIISGGLTWLFSFIIFDNNFSSGTFDIHLHDSYFVIIPFQILLPMFFLVAFLVYFVKEYNNSFRRTLPNWIFIIIGIALLINLTFLIKTFTLHSASNWTLYPPLSSLGPDEVTDLEQNPVSALITTFFTAAQFLVLAILLLVTFKWGANKQKKIN